MKKVFLLIVLACLFTGCKGEVAGGQENEQENPYAKITVINNQHDDGIDSWCIIRSIYMAFQNPNGGGEYFSIPNSTVNPGETKVFVLPDVPEGYKSPTSYVILKANSDCSRNQTSGIIDNNRTFFYYLDNDGNYKFKKTKKTITWEENGMFIVTEEDL